MALQKQPVNINFGQGLDTKSDPNQVQIGKFLALQNSMFDVSGQLTKRNGFANITTLPNSAQTTLTTLNNNLLATGSSLYAFSADTNKWLNQGSIQPVSLSVLPLVRVSTSQSSPDSAVSASGLSCTVYMDNSVAYFQISDSVTGQQVLPRTSIASIDTGETAHQAPRVFILGSYFLITYLATVGGTPHLRYMAISTSNPTAAVTAADISNVVRSTSAGYDAYVSNNTLYIAWAADATHVRLVSLTSAFVLNSFQVVSSLKTATLMSVTVDNYNPAAPKVWVTYYDLATTNGYSRAYDLTLTISYLAETQTISGLTLATLTSVASNGLLTLLLDNNQNYGFASGARTDFISIATCTQAGVVVASAPLIRSVGLASKAFIYNSTIYALIAFGSANQPSYFLMDSLGNIYLRLAYSNGGGYASTQVLPSVSSIGTKYVVPYLIKDFLAAVNKNTNTANPSSAIYTQTGINLATFSINSSGQYSSQIAGALHLTGGQLWMYDGVKPVEHGFHVFPDDILTPTTSTTGGFMVPDTYYYQFTYEWTDGQGNLHRSAPSIPVSVVVPAGTNTNSNVINVPTLRLTYKVSPNKVRIVGYRWSLLQQTYYQFTSISTPYVNDTTVDYIAITDTLASTSILGNTLLYTVGGVVEDIAAPACSGSCLYKNRLFLIDAEDPNLIWFSKQVIEAVPVEMSDLLTIYVAPTSGSQGSTGSITALSAMDDKLIIFKSNAIYYVTGSGPDNTGANNDFSDPIYVTSSVGCSNPNSIVLMSQGIMFQSDKGIWLLSRDMNTTYIGAPVEFYNDQMIQSATTIPGTNQVRFVLLNGVTLMYDYFYQQWGTFSNVYATSATLFNGLHTYLNKFGQIFQETPNLYLDGSSPVLMSFTTSWINIAGLQGYERLYFIYLLGTYITPFKLSIQLAYDYNPSIYQVISVTPNNFTGVYGSDPVFGSSDPYGGPGLVFEPRLFPQQQKCESFQMTVTEQYDASFGVVAGAGLTLSGMNIIAGVKKGYRTQKKSSVSFG